MSSTAWRTSSPTTSGMTSTSRQLTRTSPSSTKIGQVTSVSSQFHLTIAVSRLNNDIEFVQSGLTQNISMIVRASTTIIVQLVIIYKINWQLSTITLIGVSSVFCVNFLFMRA